MNAYLFTGWVSQFQHGRLIDSSSSLIVAGTESQEAAQHLFEHCLTHPNPAEEPTPTKIEKVVGAPVLDQLLTEGGSQPLDWEQITASAQRDWEAADGDDSDLGYWLDCNPYLGPRHLAPDLDSLRRALPEDLSCGLNWAEGKTRLFLVSILCAPRVPAPETEDHEAMETGRREAEDDQAGVGDIGLVEREGAFPELAEKELVMLVRARNSLVAGWLCRKNSPPNLTGHTLRIDAWCGLLRDEPPQAPAA